MRDSGETIVERAGDGDYAGKLCKCRKCETVARCTVSFDFYVIDGQDDDLLTCELCFRQFLADKGIELGAGFDYEPVDPRN